ncbi:MAG: phytanoyl-CoA dioxygenase family protein [Acidiferrobacterales bacterium]|nr:phytanoyl-CoA dioxygenase family protein [Acidiferrobacterales bacterium]
MSNIAETYNNQGFVTALDAFTEKEAQRYRAAFETAEKKYGLDQVFRQLAFGSANFSLPFVDEITQLPTIIDPVKEILGPDLLVWGAGFFNKEPRTPDFVSWHQDLNYWGLSDLEEVTAWVALSEVTSENGCMRFIPGSHNAGVVPHKDTFADENLLSRGQQLDVEVDEKHAFDNELQPGQFSLHHGRMFHASGPNRSDTRRIGLAIRYITPAMQQTSGEKPFVRLVSGRDHSGHFQLIEPATEIMSPAHIRAYQYNQKVQHQDLYGSAVQSGKQAIPAKSA